MGHGTKNHCAGEDQQQFNSQSVIRKGREIAKYGYQSCGIRTMNECAEEGVSSNLPETTHHSLKNIPPPRTHILFSFFVNLTTLL
jgi:hypothetical protein